MRATVSASTSRRVVCRGLLFLLLVSHALTVRAHPSTEPNPLPELLAQAQDPATPLQQETQIADHDAKITWHLRLDNDAFAMPHSDTNYTMGLGLNASTRDSGRTWLDRDPLFPILRGFNRIVFGQSPAWPTSRTVTLFQDDAFTPACLHAASVCANQGRPIESDRPYANLLWTGVGYTQNDVHTELDIGVIGTNVGKYVQTWIHERCCKEKIPQEWGTQIGQGGALTFLYKRIHHDRLLGQSTGKDDLKVDLKYGFWAGWNTWPTAGLTLTKGAFRASFDASYVLYDQTLQGAWWGTNKIKYSHSQIEPVVTLAHFDLDLVELAYTVGHVLFGWSNESPSWSFKLSQNWKSRDLKVGGVEPRHRWGGFDLGITF